MMSNIQLSSVETFNIQNIIFSEAKETNIPGSYRINISIKYPDKSTGPLLLGTEELYSFGIQENKSLEKPPRVVGYSIPLCLWNRDGPTDFQTLLIKVIDDISEHMKKYLLKPEVKKSIKKYDLELSDLRKFNPLWYKKEEGEVVQGRGPMIYPKLMCNKELQIYTLITDENGNQIDPELVIGQKGSVKACIKFESIFIGSKISLQLKVMELEINRNSSQRKRLICKQPEITEKIEETEE